MKSNILIFFLFGFLLCGCSGEDPVKTQCENLEKVIEDFIDTTYTEEPQSFYHRWLTKMYRATFSDNINLDSVQDDFKRLAAFMNDFADTNIYSFTSFSMKQTYFDKYLILKDYSILFSAIKNINNNRYGADKIKPVSFILNSSSEFNLHDTVFVQAITHVADTDFIQYGGVGTIVKDDDTIWNGSPGLPNPYTITEHTGWGIRIKLHSLPKGNYRITGYLSTLDFDHLLHWRHFENNFVIK